MVSGFLLGEWAGRGYPVGTVLDHPSAVKKALLVLVLALALVCVPVSQGAGGSQRASQPQLPVRGILHPGVSLAGVRLGDTVAQVKHRWGLNYKVCPYCKSPTWYFFYPTGEPLGAAVKFKDGKVVAVFTLGSPNGWRTAEGLLMGEQIDKVMQLYGSVGLKGCIGFSAMSLRNGTAVPSIYTSGAVVYGFALPAPAEPVCQ